MPSKTKESRLGQKDYWERQLKQRLSALSERGVGAKGVSKDPAVKKIRAKIRETQSRLKAIESIKRRSEELSSMKAEKAAAPKNEKGRKKKEAAAEPEVSKRQQKKKKKKEEKDQGDKPQGE